MKTKNPALAAILNLVVPGLGCAYAGSWFYAIIFFIWVPLAYFASFVVAGLITILVLDETIKNIAFAAILIILVFRIIFEQASMPYKMAIEFNQRIEEKE
jgi:hypothetical protein